MKFYLSAKKLDINSGDELICLIHELDADEYGIGVNAGDRVDITWNGIEEPLVVTVDTTESIVNEGEIGVYEDIWEKYKLEDKEVINIKLLDQAESLSLIRKKLLGERLNYEDLYSIMTDISNGRLSDIVTAYFIASGYSPGFDAQEILWMTKALAMTGDILKFEGIVADKHSIGGIGGKGITPIVVPIIAANGIKVPNTSTRAITSASATTDMLEVIMPMSFDKRQLEEMMDKSGAFMIWGGSLDLAPADDKIIRIQKFLGIESIDKFVSSIVAKKIAQGVNNVIFDVPVGESAKIDKEKYPEVKEMFETLGKEFGINVIVHNREVNGIDGYAIGPSLECREFLRVYEQAENRSLQLEEEALKMAGSLLEAVGKAQAGQGYDLARRTLIEGRAEQKLREIIENQGGDPEVGSKSLEFGGHTYEYKAKKSGVIASIHNKRTFEVAKALGNPRIKEAGLYFNVRPGDEVKAGDILVTLYANSNVRLGLGQKVVEQDKIFKWEE